MQIRINLISKDKLLNERIKIYFRKRQDILYNCTTEPLSFENTELYIAPANCIDQYNRIFPLNKKIIPIIYYGPSSFLRKAFLAGCEDYLKNPWTIEELELRVTKVIKQLKTRYSFPWGTVLLTQTDIISGENACELSFQEYKIIKTLLQHRGRPVPREVLFYSLWNNPGQQESRIIDVHISSIRKKLQNIIRKDYQDDIIISVRGIGYMIK